MEFEEMINTIQLGDCYEMIKQIPDKSIDCVYVDIPYLIGKGGNIISEKTSTLKKRIIKHTKNIEKKKSKIVLKSKKQIQRNMQNTKENTIMTTKIIEITKLIMLESIVKEKKSNQEQEKIGKHFQNSAFFVNTYYI